MRRIAIILGLALGFALAPAAAQTVPGGQDFFTGALNISVCFTCQKIVRFNVTTGKTIRVNLSTPGSFQSQKLVQRPRLGQYGTTNVSAGAYKAGNQAGSDGFSLEITVEEGGRTITQTYRLEAIVVN